MTYSTNLTSTLDKGIFLLTINSNQNDEDKENSNITPNKPSKQPQQPESLAALMKTKALQPFIII